LRRYGISKIAKSLSRNNYLAIFGPLKQLLPEIKNFCRFAHL
jgi:hypothetical protein